MVLAVVFAFGFGRPLAVCFLCEVAVRDDGACAATVYYFLVPAHDWYYNII